MEILRQKKNVQAHQAIKHVQEQKTVSNESITVNDDLNKDYSIDPKQIEKVKRIVNMCIPNLPGIRLEKPDRPLLKGTGGGLYIKFKKKSNIYISNDLADEELLWVLFHELGHHYLHGIDETTLQYENYRKNMKKIEIQANKFADLMLTLMGTAVKLVSLAQEE